MERKIYLATKADTTIGVNFDVTGNKAGRINHKHVSKQEGLAGVRESALSALVEQIEALDVEGLTAPVQIFAVPVLADMVSNGTYKFWLMTELKSSGEAVSAEELELWARFHESYVEKCLYVCVKDIFGCRLPEKPKYKVNKAQKQNDFYVRYCWDEIAKVVSDGPAVVAE